ncbi:IS200/IS605 family transposase [uncultured Draconibacterium sp.]|uniref:IS200/IS605 family transposase n=1 Tax=uncultured Draconibacterium sp. TaxID=1573823 RepID=UPI0029C8C1A1|nr:IS200/IS605 family transposase [uncultured Draconibacterium sp.]
MANTYTQIHIQAVFSVQNRLCVIRPEWETSLYRYITGIIQNNGHKLLAINGMSDHIHIFFGLRPSQSLSSLMQDVKANSSKWINQNNFVAGRFSWQEGFGAFSYSKSQISQVVDYIENQKTHHKTITFTEEYIKFLEDFDVLFDERYIFRPV